jgi:glucose-6-phosphate dehydrogenase assembly protein OpcA
MISLWDTTGKAVVAALAAERRSAGGLTSGLALTLIAVVNERRVAEAEAAATIAAAQHPCRILIVVRYDVTQPESRMDAEIVVGGRLGPCEAVVLRMRGRLALHAESVLLPLLAPDVPVVTWWHASPPERIAYDPLGVVADRRVTETGQADDPVAALAVRADDYAPGDTDLAWSRITPWRTVVAGAFEAPPAPVVGMCIGGPETDPSVALIRGWLASRLGLMPICEPETELQRVRFDLADSSRIELTKENGSVVLRRSGLRDRVLPLVTHSLGDQLAEELRRLDPDQPYAAALAAATGRSGLSDRSPKRVHIWHDPAVAERPEAVGGK